MIVPDHGVVRTAERYLERELDYVPKTNWIIKEEESTRKSKSSFSVKKQTYDFNGLNLNVGFQRPWQPMTGSS